jgi:C4-dicarboxylate-specific signal transduction histidine kinase
VTNAIEHGGDAPAVEVAVDTTATGQVTITVADDGPGLPTVERDLLRGGTETALNHGDGLGLWLVNWIVTDLGGTLDVTVDDGTTVTVELRESAAGAGSATDET